MGDSKNKAFSHWIYPLIAVIITAITFIPSLSNGFTNWDDEVYVLNNENIKEFSWEKIKYWFGAYHHGNYHPLTMISYMWEYNISKLDPKIYHVNNYLLHILNTFLVFVFVNGLVKKKEVALVVATLFGIHPMHVESVAWVSERKDVLYTSFYLGALIAYVNFVEKDNWKLYGVMFLLFVGSLLSKSAAVVLPVVLLLIDYFQKREFSIRLLVEKAPLFLLSFVFGIVAIKSQNATEAIADFDTFTTGERVFFAGYGSIIYIIKAIIPTGLTAFHPYPSYIDGNKTLPYAMYIYSGVSVLLFGGILTLWKRSRFIVFGLLFYLVNVALVLQFVSVGSAIYSERYSYVAYLGLFFLFAVALDTLVEKKKSLIIPVYAGVAIICLGFSYLSFKQCKTWKDTFALWNKFNEVYPKINHGHVKLAEYYLENGDDAKALEKFDYVVKNYPGSSKATMGRANLLAKKGDYDQALKDYATALALNPNLTDVYVNRAITYSILKQYDNAFADYAKAIQYDPNNIQIYQNRGFAFLDNGNFQEAINDFTIVLQVQPQNGRLLFLRALAYHRSQNFEKAIEEYSKVLQLNPNNGDAAHNRAISHEAAGNFKSAYQDILLAQKLGKQENPVYVEKLRKLAESSK